MMIRKRPKRMKDLIPLTNGIFGHMNYTFRAEVTKGNLDLLFLSNYGQKNPSPIIEIIHEEDSTAENDYLTSQELTTLAAAIVEMYGVKWDKLGDIYDIEYDPIHNYLDEWEDESSESGSTQQIDDRDKEINYGRVDSLAGTRTDDFTVDRSVASNDSSTRTDNLTELETRNLASGESRTDNLTETHTYGKTSTRTDNLSEVVDEDTTNSNTGSQDDAIYGFNSATAVGSNESDTSDSGSGTRDVTTTNTGTQATAETGSDGITNTGTQSTTGTDTGTVTTANTGTQQNTSSGTVSEITDTDGTRSTSQINTQSGKDTISDIISSSGNTEKERDRSGRHFGNIGNLTSQKQILEEIELWRWNYMQEILNDVKEFCCLPVYQNPWN